MKLLFDQNLSYKLVSILGDAFPESAQVRSFGFEETDDLTLRKFAAANSYVLVTKDVDLAEMAALFGNPKTIWLRCGNQPTKFVASLLLSHQKAILEFEADDNACLEIY